MKLPTAMQIAGVDDLDLYLCGFTSHDGTAALRVDASPIRVVCANTQCAAIENTKGTYTFRQTSNVRQQIAQAREAMGLMWKYLDGFQTEAEKMLNEALTMGEFEKVVAELWPVADDASDTTKNNAKKRASTLHILTELAGVFLQVSRFFLFPLSFVHSGPGRASVTAAWAR